MRTQKQKLTQLNRHHAEAMKVNWEAKAIGLNQRFKPNGNPIGFSLQ